MFSASNAKGVTRPMNDELDPIEWLRRHDPLVQATADPSDRERGLERLRERIRSERRRRNQRRAIIAAVAIAGSSTAAGVAAVILTRTSPDPTSVTCFAAADLDANRAVVGLDDDAVAACRAAWNDPSQREILTGSIPDQLAACRLPSGATAVFPADSGDPCAALGLDAGAAHGPDDAALRAVEQRLVDHLDGNCVPVDDLVALAQADLNEHDLGHWTAVSSSESDSGSCGSISIDTSTETVWVVPLPPMPPSPPPTTNP